jgi:hypothetical protein
LFFWITHGSRNDLQILRHWNEFIQELSTLKCIGGSLDHCWIFVLQGKVVIAPIWHSPLLCVVNKVIIHSNLDVVNHFGLDKNFYRFAVFSELLWGDQTVRAFVVELHWHHHAATITVALVEQFDVVFLSVFDGVV